MLICQANTPGQRARSVARVNDCGIKERIILFVCLIYQVLPHGLANKLQKLLRVM